MTEASKENPEYKSEKLEIKQLINVEIKDMHEDEKGVFVGYGSMFKNVDQGGDVVEVGAFTDAIKMHKSGKRKIKLLYQHDYKMPIGTIDEVEQDEKGLKMKAKLLVDQGVSKADEAYALLKAGAIDGLSIGYMVVDSDITKAGIRQIKAADLREVSVVTFPMNEEATVTDVKSRPNLDPRSIERILRDAGVPKNAAKSIVAGGVKSNDSDIGCDAQDDEVKQLLNDVLTNLRSITHGHSGVKES